jgi:hypothetical protein
MLILILPVIVHLMMSPSATSMLYRIIQVCKMQGHILGGTRVSEIVV